jgi:spore coat protein U-like protein
MPGEGRVIARIMFAGLIACLPTTAWGACSVSGSGLAFGTYNPNDAQQTFSGTVTVTCTLLSGLGGYTLKLSSGGGGTYSARSMALASSVLAYQLYQESALVTVWGDGTGGSVIITENDLLAKVGGVRRYSVYGRIPVKQLSTPGTYTDALVVTLDY